MFEPLKKSDSGVTHTMNMHGRNLFLAFLNEKRKVQVSAEELKSILDTRLFRSIVL